MPAGRILVIAPNPDFRKSLTFALEAEGYEVTAQAIISDADAGKGFDCVVLDHNAATGARDVVAHFCAHSPRLIFLASHVPGWLAGFVGRVVQTPLVGTALIEAVADVSRVGAAG